MDIRGPGRGVVVGAGGVGVHPGLVCPHPVHTGALTQLQGLGHHISPGAVSTLLLPGVHIYIHVNVQTQPPGHNMCAPDNKEGDDDTYIIYYVPLLTHKSWLESPESRLPTRSRDH